MITLVLALVAHATPSPEQDELAAAEVDALALIAACEAEGTACGASPEALGEAFLVRGAAAAVLRGEIDTTAAANARWLAPDAALAWRALLPSADGEPEAWVLAWRPVIEAPVVVTPEVREAHEPVPWRLGDPDPSVLRIDAIVLPGRGELGIGGTADARFTVAGPIVAYVGAGLNYEHSEVDLSPLGTDVDRVDSWVGRVRLGFGPRWASRNSGEVMPYAYALVDSSAPTWATFQALYDDGLKIDPGSYGFGGGIGAVGVHPVSRDLALGWDARVEALKRWLQANYTDGRRRDDLSLPDVDRDDYARDHVDAMVRTDLRWRPGGGPTTLSLGVEFRFLTALESPEWPTMGTTVRGGPVLGVGWIL